MTETDADLVFFPWIRRGASAALLTPDTNGADLPGLTTATASVEINASRTASTPVTVMGPGHVTGLDRRQVVRTDPGSRSDRLRVQLLPADRARRARAAVAVHAGRRQRRGTSAAVAVPRGRAPAGRRTARPAAGRGPGRCCGSAVRPSRGDELPDLTDSWAWAHGQLTAKTSDDLAAITGLRPGRARCRGWSARGSCSRTPSYLACVVPTFELGRKAGLGDDDPAAPTRTKLEPAWTPGRATSVELPVYHSWTFATGAGGDFQSLALLLRARPLPDGIGEIEIDVGESGLLSDVPAGTRLPLRGALQPVGTAPTQLGRSRACRPTWEQALRPVLNAPAEVTAEEDPLLAPPLYGAAQARSGHRRGHRSPPAGSSSSTSRRCTAPSPASAPGSCRSGRTS